MKQAAPEINLIRKMASVEPNGVDARLFPPEQDQLIGQTENKAS